MRPCNPPSTVALNYGARIREVPGTYHPVGPTGWRDSGGEPNGVSPLRPHAPRGVTPRAGVGDDELGVASLVGRAHDDGEVDVVAVPVYSDCLIRWSTCVGIDNI